MPSSKCAHNKLNREREKKIRVSVEPCRQRFSWEGKSAGHLQHLILKPFSKQFTENRKLIKQLRLNMNYVYACVHCLQKVVAAKKYV